MVRWNQDVAERQISLELMAEACCKRLWPVVTMPARVQGTAY
jgi:hypothetical protein